MRLARKVEVQPTPTQRQALLQHAGNARWAYNFGLRLKTEAISVRKALIASGTAPKDAPKVPSAIDLHRELNALKKVPVEDGGVPWMYSASKAAPQEALRDLDCAFQHFYRRIKAGEKPGYPRFKSRKQGIGGFRLTGSVRVQDRFVTLPVLGRLRVKPGDRRYLPVGSHGTASVTEHAGRWYVSILEPGDAPSGPTQNGGSEVGVDLGVERLATLSDGAVIANPRALKREGRKLRLLQKEVSRKTKGSKNRAKANLRLRRAHARVANIRRDALHKATTMLTKNHGRIVIEDLRVKNMTRAASGAGRRAKAGLNRSVLDACFGEFRRLLEYKGRLYGCEVVAVNPAYTSQRCSTCGHTEAGNRRSQAEFMCLSCGFTKNADVNAAVNILRAGSCPATACGGGVRLGGNVKQLSVKQESVVA